MAKLIGFKKIKTCVFISGRGSNFKNLIKFSLSKKSPIKIFCVVSNNLNAKGLKTAKKYKLEFFVHGDDWKKGPQSKEREILIETMKKWNGIVLEFKYTKNVSSTKIKKNYKQK